MFLLFYNGSDILRLMGLDVGDRRIGVAVSDPLMITAQGLPTVYRRQKDNSIDFICNYIKEYNVEKLIVGLPKNMNGSIGFQAKKVQEYTKELEEASKLEIVFWDERLTSMQAQRVMIMADESRAKRKKKIDMLAAMLILQSYMDCFERK